MILPWGVEQGMKPRRRSRRSHGTALSAAPMQEWSRLAWRTGEMMLASAQVIVQRSSRMAVAGPLPGKRDRDELARMSQEKIEAAVECVTDVAAQAALESWHNVARLWQDSWRIGAGLSLLLASTTPAQAWHRQGRLMREMADSAHAASRIGDAALALSGKALDPLHRRTRANLKRLQRRT
jgi:hypothetical protein